MSIQNHLRRGLHRRALRAGLKKAGRDLWLTVLAGAVAFTLVFGIRTGWVTAGRAVKLAPKKTVEQAIQQGEQR